jgi:hypothetical protein
MTPNDTKPRGDKRPRRLSLFAAALMVHGSIAAAAKASGISKRTGIRWMQTHPEIAEQLRTAGAQAWACASGQIQLGSLEAIEYLRQVIRDGESESSRVAASRCLLELTQKVIEASHLEQRLTALEQIAKNWRPNERPIHTPVDTNRGINGSA